MAKCFLAYVEQVPMPALGPGDIVLIGNLGIETVRRVQAASVKLFFLPPYSLTST
jgi:hypothetical protein